MLRKYIAVHLPWSIEQGRFTVGERQFYITAGHLQTRYGTPLYLVFQRIDELGRSPWRLVAASSQISAPELPTPPEIPPAPVLERGSEIVMSHEHILGENSERVPFLQNTPRVAQMCAIAGAIQWSLNRGLQLPHWYFGQMNYIVPLYLQSRENITRAPDLIAPVQVSPGNLVVRTVVQPNSQPQVDLGPFIALQRWLTAAGITRVAVPFADVLADLVPSHTVRMRRDFRQLLTTIQAVAFLYQRQRQLTPEGWVEATIGDYVIARELLESVFDAVAAEAVSLGVRATVEAVKAGEEISETALAQRLKLSKSTISYRVGRALNGGWLLNRETRKGYAARLALGAGLPDVVSALPTEAQIRAAFDCSNGSGEDDPPSTHSVPGVPDPEPDPAADTDSSMDDTWVDL